MKRPHTTLKYKSKGEEVEQLKKMLVALGYPVLDEQANYFGKASEQTVKIIQEKEGLKISGVVDQETFERINSLYQKAIKLPKRKISGTIYNNNDEPLADVLVKVYDKDLRSEQQLGQIYTNKNGQYYIEYNDIDFIRNENKTADVFIKVLRRTDRFFELLGESPIHFNVPNDFVLDFKPDQSPYRGISEFDHLIKIIEPLLPGDNFNIGDLREDKEYKDISFLAGETGEEESKIAKLPIAFQFSSKTDIAANIFYGLFRLQYPMKMEELLSLTGESISEGIKLAIEQNIISAKWEKEITKTIQILNALSSEFILTGNSEKNIAFKKVIGTTIPKAAEQKVFVNTYLKHESQPDQFWKALENENGFDAQKIETLQTSLRLNQLTMEVAPLTANLILEQKQDAELKELRGFAKFNQTDWKKRIKRLVDSGQIKTFPDSIEGETVEEKTKNYAQNLNGLISDLFPTDVFRNKLIQDNQNPFGRTARDLATFFSNNPDFDLQTNRINTLFDAADLNGVRNPQAVEKELKTINRLSKLAPRYEDISILRNKNIDSATSVVSNYSKLDFQKTFGNTIGAENADSIYNKSVEVDKQATALIVKHKTRHDISVYAINGAEPLPSDYQNMFGDKSLCYCEHCQSVYSPSAYLVDLLQFMKQKSVNESAFDIFSQRRPDVKDILLTCKNTNTPLPYIDLVNELLENLIAPAVTPLAHQTNNMAAELDAFPEHVNTAAYTILKTANSSFKLPLNLPLEATRLYLDKLNIKRYELIKLFYGKQNDSVYNSVDIAADYLGLSRQELDIINGTTQLGSPSMVEVKTYLEETGITYIDLLQLLECYFINPRNAAGEAAITIVARIADDGEQVIDPATCNIDDLIFNGIATDTSDKLQRFIRLWKKLEWDIFDLDRLFTALPFGSFNLTPSEINNQLIVPLANAARLIKDYRLEAQQVFLLWNIFDTNKYFKHQVDGKIETTSLYEGLFLNKKISQPLDPDFADFTTLKNNANPNVSVRDKSALIISALKISQDDFEILVNTLSGTPFNNEDLTLFNLSVFYRFKLLARMLRMSLEDIIFAIDLIKSIDLQGITPFGISTKIVDKIKIAQSSGFKMNELSDLLTNREDNYEPFLDTDIARALTTIQEGLQQIAIQFPDAAQATEKLKSHNAFIANALAAELDTDSEIAFLLINNFVKSTADNTSDAISLFLDDEFINGERPVFSIDAAEQVTWGFEDLKDTYLLVDKVWKRLDKLISKLKLSPEEFIYFFKNDSAFGLSEIWKLPENASANLLFAPLEKLVQLVHFRNALIVVPPDWYTLFDHAFPGNNLSKNNFTNTLANLLDIEPESFELLLGNPLDTLDKGILNLDFPDDYTNSTHLLNVLQCIRTAQQYGSSTDQLLALTAEDGEETIAKSLLKSKYDESTWLEIVKPLSDQLREIKRDALVSFILTTDNAALPDFRDSNAIYEHFLIDTEMAACMKTSRIKQATLSIQLFIDRCLMNLEPGVSLTNDFGTQWNKWRKIYRVWEANRKVFLYPENWIEPELRDDKTPLFKKLVKKLGQNEITDEIAQEALQEYLEGLDEIANLETMGFFLEEETRIMHVIGRTNNIPHHYYYRKQENSVWSAWEKIDLDIEGDHILPVVWNGRLYLFWGLFEEKEEKSNVSLKLLSSLEGGNITSDNTPLKFLEMKLAWSEYKKNKWGGKSLSNDFIKIGGLDLKTKHFISMNSAFKEDELLIQVYTFGSFQTFGDPPAGVNNISFVKSFNFDYCNGSPNVLKVTVGNNKCFRVPIGLQFSTMKLEKNFSDNLKIYDNGFYKPISCGPILDPKIRKYSIFKNVEEDFQILPKHHNVHCQNNPNFFFNSKRDNFYAKPIKNISLESPDQAFDNDVNKVLARDNFDSSLGLNTNIDLVPADVLANPNTVPTTFVDVFCSSKGANHLFLKNHYKFQTNFHPFVCDFIKTINTHGLDEFYSEANQNPEEKALIPSNKYDPGRYLLKPYPKASQDFDYSGTYSIYNWELFFHIPLYIATRLSQNQKFDEARKWFHYIFDPTETSSTDSGIARFWKTKPFKKEIADGLLPIADLLSQEENEADLKAQLDNWERYPFNPHAVARLRNSAYMRSTVMKYVDNLISWGDQLFQRDTLESINEATQLYILAANMLGKKPLRIPPRAEPVDSSYTSLTVQGELDAFSNAKVAIQNFISPSDTNVPSDADNPLLMSFFCLPGNSELLAYWETVADRLFKIRNCMNIDGVIRQLPVFQPPIDPGQLVRATAAGLDLNSILADINASLPNYRFQVMIQKAKDICNDVKNLGSLLLSVLEKKDAEELALLRNNQELKLLDLILDIKEQQKEEAKINVKSLRASRKVIEERKNYYESREFKNSSESLYFNSLGLGILLQTAQSTAQIAASIMHKVPDVKVGPPFASGFTYGGSHMGAGTRAAADVLGTLASINAIGGNMANVHGGHQRRMDDWKFQAKTAALDLKQIDQQIIAAEIRLSIAEKEIKSQKLQIKNSNEINEYLRNKFTNEDLYDYMLGKVSATYFQSYQLAYDTAKKAEKCMEVQLKRDHKPIIKFGYWDSLKKGLLAGEQLGLDLQRLDMAYLDKDIREFELTKHISLRQLAPEALLQLKAVGVCNIELPEWLFDLDNAGHYMRRIMNVAISIPAISGPYTNINCTLSLEDSKIRIDDSLLNGIMDDSHFERYFSGTKSMVTSSGQNDSGLFEPNLRDERYLPFENAGVISNWKLELPNNPNDPDDISMRQFDYNTITDVVFHVRYCARQGQASFKNAAFQNLTSILNSVPVMHRLFSLRHDFAGEWHQFETGDDNFKALIKKEYFNYLTQGKQIENLEIHLFTINEDQKLDLIDNSAIITNLNTFINQLNDPNENHQSDLEVDKNLIEKDNYTFILMSYTLDN